MWEKRHKAGEHRATPAKRRYEDPKPPHRKQWSRDYQMMLFKWAKDEFPSLRHGKLISLPGPGRLAAPDKAVEEYIETLCPGIKSVYVEGVDYELHQRLHKRFPKHTHYFGEFSDYAYHEALTGDLDIVLYDSCNHYLFRRDDNLVRALLTAPKKPAMFMFLEFSRIRVAHGKGLNSKELFLKHINKLIAKVGWHLACEPHVDEYKGAGKKQTMMWGCWVLRRR